jgi:cupin superfamily acireductone dioxygenase involved in methionine salvage
MEIKKGDLFVLPPGMYHRFTLDENQYLKVSKLPCHAALIYIYNHHQVDQDIVAAHTPPSDHD